MMLSKEEQNILDREINHVLESTKELDSEILLSTQLAYQMSYQYAISSKLYDLIERQTTALEHIQRSLETIQRKCKLSPFPEEPKNIPMKSGKNHLPDLEVFQE